MDLIAIEIVLKIDATPPDCLVIVKFKSTMMRLNQLTKCHVV